MNEKKIIDLGVLKSDMAIGCHISNLRGKRKGLGYKNNIAWEQKDVYTVRGDSGRKIRRITLIDREKDKYREEVIDLETNEVTHFCEHSLKEHQGHGSAKEKKKQNL